MKKIKKLLVLLLCLAMVQVPVEMTAMQPVTVQAATVKKGLVTEKGKIYYYENGVKVKSAWKTVKGKRYYFSKKGYALQAPKMSGFKSNIVVKKIGKYYYGFDTKGRMVKGIQVGNSGKFYYFSPSTGKYHTSRSKKLRNAAKEGRSVATLKKVIKSYGGKLKKIQSLGYSCYKPNALDKALIYGNLKVYYFKDRRTGKETVYMTEPR